GNRDPCIRLSLLQWCNANQPLRRVDVVFYIHIAPLGGSPPGGSIKRDPPYVSPPPQSSPDITEYLLQRRNSNQQPQAGVVDERQLAGLQAALLLQVFAFQGVTVFEAVDPEVGLHVDQAVELEAQGALHREVTELLGPFTQYHLDGRSAQRLLPSLMQQH